MKSLFIRDGAEFDWEIIVTDEDGQVGEPIGLNDKQLLELGFSISKYQITAWHRIKRQISSIQNREI